MKTPISHIHRVNTTEISHCHDTYYHLVTMAVELKDGNHNISYKLINLVHLESPKINEIDNNQYSQIFSTSISHFASGIVGGNKHHT